MPVISNVVLLTPLVSSVFYLSQKIYIVNCTQCAIISHDILPSVESVELLIMLYTHILLYTCVFKQRYGQESHDWDFDVIK